MLNMLEKAILRNFQSHKETVMEFVPGVNVIIGPSDAGKSAVFRGVNWPITNRPLGDFFRAKWGGDTEVALHFSEGNVIERAKTDSKNEYRINGKDLTGFGSEVPEEVTKILQIDPANIQAQMNMPFLLSNTPGEAARMLNKAASIDDIDHALSGLRKKHNQIDNDIKYDEKQLSEYNEQMKQYEDIPVLEEKLQLVEDLEKERIEKAESLKSLQHTTNKAREIEDRLKETEHIPGLLDKCTKAEKQFRSYQDKLAQHKKYSITVNRAKEIQNLLNETEYVDKAMPILKKAEAGFSEWKEKNKRLEELKRLVDKVKKVSASINRTEEKINQLEQEYHELAPEHCPLCGNRML